MAPTIVVEKPAITNALKVVKKNGKIHKQKKAKPLTNFVTPIKDKTNDRKNENLLRGVPTTKCYLPKAYPFELTVEVSNLPPGYKEVDLIESFNKYGSITYLQKISKKKAIVAFLKSKEASAAALKANKVARIGDQVLTVKTRSKKIKEADESAQRIIFIYRANSAITEDDIKKHFEECGKILSVETKKLASEIYFIVEFSDSAASQAALKLHNSILKDSVLSIRLKSKNCVAWYPSRTISLLNKNNLTKLEGSVVTSIFAKCGEIENCDVFCEKHKLAMITFKQDESAAKALKLNGKNLNGLSIAVELYSTELQRHALPQKVDEHADRLDLARSKKRKVYIKKIPTDATEEDLKDLFKCCGPVEKVSILSEKGAVVEFSNSDGYCKAFALHSYAFMGQNLYLVPFSEQKTETNAKKRPAPNQNKPPKKLKKTM